jgi:hypothetical protein
MTDESLPFDSFPYREIWPDWMRNALWNSPLMPRERRQVPARVAVDWEASPNGGAIARPSPLWNHGNSRHWVESLLPAPPADGNGGILGDLGAELMVQSGARAQIHHAVAGVAAAGRARVTPSRTTRAVAFTAAPNQRGDARR